MGKKARKVHKFKILQSVLAFFWVLAMNFFGLFLPSSPIAYLCFPVILVLTAYSIFGYSSFVKKISAIRLDEAENLMLKEQTQANENFNEYLRDLASDINFLYLYIAVYFILSSIMVLFLDNTSSFIVRFLYSVISFFIIWMLLELLIRKKKNILDGNPCLSREEYPSLYSLADKAFEGTGLKVNIICTGGSSIGAMRHNSNAYVTLGAYNYSILSDNELLSLMAHERYHLHELSKTPLWKAEPISRITPADFSTALIPVTILLQYPLTRLSHSYAVTDIATTGIREKLCLKYIRDNGLSDSFATGIAKIRMLYFFDNIEVRNHVMFYKSEVMREDIVSAELKYFRRVFEVRKDLWHKILKSEIPDYGNYRLSYSQTCAELGTVIPEVELDPGTVPERLALLQYADTLIANESRDSYSKDRQNWYLEPQKIIEDYDASLKVGREYSVIELRPVLDACDALNLDDRLIDLCYKNIEQAAISNQSAHAHFLLGRELLRGYDSEGLDHVLFAMDVNENYIREGSELIESFCRLFGLRDELNRYAQRIRDITQLAADRNLLQSNEITPFDKLTADESIPESLMSDNIDFIVKACGSGLNTIWQLRKELSDSYFSTIYIVQFDSAVSQDEIDISARRIFNYLDGQTRHYAFMLREECPIDPDTIPDSCVYKK